MDLTVLLCTYNRAPLLRNCLEALMGQAVPAGLQWELVVVDNNSKDSTPVVVDAAKVEAPMPVRYVFEARQGKSFALNTGIEHAKGSRIAFTDDDVKPAPDWIAMTWRAFDDGAADVVGGRILPDWTGPVPRWLEHDRDLHDRLALMEHESPVTLTEATRRPRLWGANMALRRDILARTGGFDTRLGPMGNKLYRGGEETDLVARALAAGGTIVYDPRLVVWHHIGPERMSRAYFRRHAFQGAEGDALRASPRHSGAFLGAPHYRYRRAVETLAAWAVAAGCLRPYAFQRELDFLEAAGCLWGHWLAHWRRSP